MYPKRTLGDWSIPIGLAVIGLGYAVVVIGPFFF